MRAELDVLNRNISVPGCEFTRTALRFEGVVDEGALLRAGACLQMITTCGDWWWGDYLVAYAEWRLRKDHTPHELAALDESDKERYRKHYVRNHGSVANGRELAETQIERYKVASFYEAAARVEELSHEHHRQAIDGSGGDLAVAQEWLRRAQEAGWTRNQMRSEMRAAKRAGPTAESAQVTCTQQELFAFKRWSRVQLRRVGEMEVDELRALLADLAPALELARSAAERLTAVAGAAKLAS